MQKHDDGKSAHTSDYRSTSPPEHDSLARLSIWSKCGRHQSITPPCRPSRTLWLLLLNSRPTAVSSSLYGVFPASRQCCRRSRCERLELRRGRQSVPCHAFLDVMSYVESSDDRWMDGVVCCLVRKSWRISATRECCFAERTRPAQYTVYYRVS